MSCGVLRCLFCELCCGEVFCYELCCGEVFCYELW